MRRQLDQMSGGSDDGRLRSDSSVFKDADHDEEDSETTNERALEAASEQLERGEISEEELRIIQEVALRSQAALEQVETDSVATAVVDVTAEAVLEGDVDDDLPEPQEFVFTPAPAMRDVGRSVEEEAEARIQEMEARLNAVAVEKEAEARVREMEERLSGIAQQQEATGDGMLGSTSARRSEMGSSARPPLAAPKASSGSSALEVPHADCHVRQDTEYCTSRTFVSESAPWKKY